MKYSLVLAFILLFTMACSPKKSDSDESLVTGYQLIDEGRNDEAVTHFETLLETHPENQDYQRGLGSSYAARAGFSVQMLAGPMKSIQEIDAIKNSARELLEKVLGSGKNLKSVEAFLAAELEILALIRKLQAIPRFSKSALWDLKEAISIYSTLPNRSQGDHLYLAVLSALVMRSQLENSNLNFGSCQQALMVSKSLFFSTASQYIKILDFLKMAQPSRSKDYQEQIKRVVSSMGQLNDMTSEMMGAVLIGSSLAASSPLQIFKTPPTCNE